MRLTFLTPFMLLILSPSIVGFVILRGGVGGSRPRAAADAGHEDHQYSQKKQTLTPAAAFPLKNNVTALSPMIRTKEFMDYVDMALSTFKQRADRDIEAALFQQEVMQGETLDALAELYVPLRQIHQMLMELNKKTRRLQSLVWITNILVLIDFFTTQQCK